MDLGLAQKNFVVLGASRGIGRSVALNLLNEGANTLLVSRGEKALETLQSEAEGAVEICASDLSTASGVDLAAARAKELEGGVSGVLVNGGGPPFGAALELSDAEWEEAFWALIGGPVRLLRPLAPGLNENSSVLFVTSSSVRQPIENLDASNVLRPGVAALAKVLSRSLGPSVRVNSLAPGRIATDRSRSLDEARARQSGVSLEEQRRAFSENIPLGRYGEPEELARAAVFLLSPAASYVSGVSLQVDGGLVAAVP